MNVERSNQVNKASQSNAIRPKGVLQRKCACGQHTPGGGECTTCSNKKLTQPLQTKLKIGEANDRYEQEADRVAEQVMKIPEPNQGNPGNALKTRPLVQRKTSATQGGASKNSSTVQDVLGTTGQPLDRATRDFMEPRFGRDFRAVRVHSGAIAAKSARVVNARAFTVGQNIVFGSSEYAPKSSPGRRLLAHELAHTIQQGSGAQYLQRMVEVQPGTTAANDILGQFNSLCNNGNFTVDANNRIQSDCIESSPGCDCLCDVTTDPSRAYVIEVHNVTNSPSSETLHDGSTETIPMPSVGPDTVPGQHPTIHMPSSTGSAMGFGAFKDDGSAFIANNARILVHELCGHARKNLPNGGVKGNRPGHDATINVTNSIVGSPLRGKFTDPRQGESFHQLPVSSAKKVFKLVDGWHHEYVP